MTHKKCAENTFIKKTGRIGRKDLHKAILQAAEAAGGEYGEAGLVSYLQRQALAAPSPFLTLLGKVLIEAEDKMPPSVRRIELVPAASADKQDSVAVQQADACR